MSVVPRHHAITMVCRSLDAVPAFPVPDGFTPRWFKAGDQRIWFDIHLATERHLKISRSLFQEQFGSDESILAMRQCFLLDLNNVAVATGSVWFDDFFNDPRMGRIHWVAVTPEEQGRGLGKALMTILCRRLLELGYTGAYLRTSSARLAAIALYRKFGFVPLLRGSTDESVWKQVEAALTRL